MKTNHRMRPSEHMADLANRMRERVALGMGLTSKELAAVAAVLEHLATSMGALEKMLERRLTVRDIPWRSGGGAPPAPANGGVIIQFRPRPRAVVVPFGGGAA